jgi:hypothetical protein
MDTPPRNPPPQQRQPPRLQTRDDGDERRREMRETQQTTINRINEITEQMGELDRILGKPEAKGLALYRHYQLMKNRLQQEYNSYMLRDRERAIAHIMDEFANQGRVPRPPPAPRQQFQALTFTPPPEQEGSGKSSYVIAIPSYDRVDTLKKKTIALLERNKIPKDIVHIFVANDEEAKKYKEEFSDYKIITGVKGIMKQRNFMTDYFPEGKHIVYIDDDIMEVLEKVGKSKESKTMRNVDLIKFFPFAFDELKKRNLYIWGIHPVNNPYYMGTEISTDLRYIMGGFQGVINRKSSDLKMRYTSEKEDVERTLRFYKKDKGVLRFNYITIKTINYAPGGIVSEVGSKEARQKAGKETVEKLLKEFPGYGTSKQRPSGIYEFVFKRKPDIKGGAIPKQRERDADFTDTTIYTPAIRNPAKVAKLRANLLEVLRRSTIPSIPKPKLGRNTNRGNKLGTIGRTMTLGFGDTRHGIKQFSINKKYPELLKALIEYGNAIVPKGFEYNAITINEGVKAKKHIDSKNGGVSFITGVGDFTGGNIRVFDKDNKKTYKDYDLKDKAVGFNGGLLYHQTTPFKGERYTIIYYKQMWEGNITGYKTVGSGKDTEYDRLMEDGAIFA